MVRAKFKVIEVEDNANGSANIHLTPVIGGSPENDDFYKWTPAGEIRLSTINAEAAKRFEVGTEYYVDFTPAE